MSIGPQKSPASLHAVVAAQAQTVDEIRWSDRHLNEFQRMREALVAIALVCKDEKAKGNPLKHDAIRDVARYGLGMEEDAAPAEEEKK